MIWAFLTVVTQCGNHRKSISSQKKDFNSAAWILDTNAQGDSQVHEVIRNDFKIFYDEYDVDGMFVLIDARTNEYTFYNKLLYKQPSTPASTFNILFTLIGLQEGVIKDENSTISEGKTARDTGYNEHLTLKTAFEGNYESFFRQMIRIIPPDRMKYWLEKANYGNKKINDHIYDFWLGNTLQITPEEQLNFIRKFARLDLPFSSQYFQILKRMMLDKNSPDYKVFGKRGSYKLADQNKYIGWFTGYIETSKSTYFFVNFIQSPNLNHSRLVDAQKEIPYKILRLLKLAY